MTVWRSMSFKPDHNRSGSGFLFLLALAVFAFQAAPAAACGDPLAREAALAGAGEAVDRVAVTEFYRSWGAGCAWTQENTAAFMHVLDGAAAHGLDPRAFHAEALKRGVPEEERDLLLTDAALAYARAMNDGRFDLARIEDDVDFPPSPGPGAVAQLKGALARGDAASWLASLPPKQPEYARLMEALAKYRALAAQGGWPVLQHAGPSLRPGEHSPLVPLLKRRLAAEGDLAAADDDLFFGAAAVDALKHFQSRNGLDVDGVLGKKSLAALNISAAERVAQIEANLERWRAFAHAIPPTRIEVNAAAASAALIVDGERVLAMRAIVGEKKTPTPILVSEVKTIVINPPWVVPESIIRKEILPALARRPDYLEKNRMRWIDGQLVQEPGEKNSLGRIKFEFANPFHVYLHDTPYRSLFARDERARSHGCVRLEKPVDLAEWLLERDPAWPRERIEQTIADGATLRIPLRNSIPVIIAYWTSFVDADGTVEFRNDIYGRDIRLLAALDSVRPAPQPETSVQGAAAISACGV